MNYKKVRKLRAMLSLTQAQFAIKLKVSEPTIRNWERMNGPEPSNLGLSRIKDLMIVESIDEKELL